jgi:hypothetical protein
MTEPSARAGGSAATGEESASERLRFAALVSAVFAILLAPCLLTHELWRDEAWQWLVVSESHSFAQLFDGLSRGGAGSLVPILDFLALLVSSSPRAMQAVQLLIATAGAFAFVRWAPLRRWQRATFVFGYFPFYEYGVISRPYGMGVLLLWLACAATRGRRPALGFAAAIGLLCQTTFHGYILAIALVCGWLLDRWWRRAELAPLTRSDVAVGLLLAIAGAIAGIVQFVPAPETKMPALFFRWNAARLETVAAIPWRAFVPLPRFELHFWNTNLLEAWPAQQALAGVLVLAVAFLLLRSSRVALATFAIGAAGLLAFCYVSHPGQIRYQGHLWLLLLGAAWLGGGAGFDRGWRRLVVAALLVAHVAAAAFATSVDLRHPFSNGRATAAFLRSQGLDRYPLLGHREPPAATVSLYLGRPLYSPSRRVFITHWDWSPLQREVIDSELRCAARELAQSRGDVVIVENRELPPWEELEPAGSVVGAIVPTEDYHLYRLRRDRLAATAALAACRPPPFRP